MNTHRGGRIGASVLSEARAISQDDGIVLMMIGSYAPAHIGHIAAMTAAVSALHGRGEKVLAVVYVPNGDAYVSYKTDDRDGTWSLDRRIDLMLGLLPGLVIPTFVDDITGTAPGINPSVTKAAMATISDRLRIPMERMVVVVGSDQAASMRPYVSDNRAVCVVRPGAVACILNMLGEEWFYHAVASGRYIFTERDNPFEDISSTTIRNAARGVESENRD